MSELRPQLGSTLPDMLTKFVKEDGTLTLEGWRVIERLSEMNADDESFMLEVRSNQQDLEIDDLKAQIAELTAAANEALDAANNALTQAENNQAQALAAADDAQNAANVAQQAFEDAQALAITATEDGQLFRPTGSLGDLDEAASDNLVDGTLGTISIGTDTSTNWYTGGGTPTKATADYDDIVITSPDFTVSAGDRVRVEYTYTMRGLKDMFEWFTWQELVRVMDTTAQVLVLENNIRSFGCATNSGVPGGYDATEDFVNTHTVVVYFDVPALTGAWPSGGLINIQLKNIPNSAASGGTDCMSGGTFNASVVATDFKLENTSVSAQVVAAGPTTFLG